MKTLKRLNFLETLQDDLTWTTHIHDKCKKVSQILAVLTKLKHNLPKHTLKTIYNALIEPHLTYAITNLPNSVISISMCHILKTVHDTDIVLVLKCSKYTHFY